jgi:amidase
VADEEELAFAGVAGQAALLGRREVSARELAELALVRIAALDGELGAFAATYPERALAEAERADERRRAGDGSPLLGIPVAVKDEIDLAGEVTSRGTGAFTTPAAADADVIAHLRAAGAVIVGKTTMPELGLWPFTESVTWGVTRNPWDLDRTPGGSSGGSAAAVAAGLVPAALAVDGAGSIRIPAACCGLFGLKPQYGRVPRAPHDADGTHWICFGALTRSVLDTALVLDAIRRPDPAPATAFADAARADPGRLRIAVSRAFPAGTRGRLDPDVERAMEETAEALRELGHTVVEGETGFAARDIPVILGLLFRAIRDFVAEVERPQRLERRTRAIARPGALVGDRVRHRLLVAEARMGHRIRAGFTDHDVLLTPAMAQPAVPAQLMEGRGATVTYLWETGWVPFEVLWNATGQPAASVPAGFTAGGLPLAVQLVGRPDGERTLLGLAAQLERIRPWAHRRPPFAAGQAAGNEGRGRPSAYRGRPSSGIGSHGAA